MTYKQFKSLTNEMTPDTPRTCQNLDSKNASGEYVLSDMKWGFWKCNLNGVWSHADKMHVELFKAGQSKWDYNMCVHSNKIRTKEL